jgi:PTH2 family peptidyl-tRNA hydrolase
MKQVILIRKDLKMRRGKEIAQGSHASMAFILRNYVDEAANKIDSEEELLELHKKALESGLEANYITDAGRTEFNGVPTKTCLAIGPNNSEYIDKITKHLKLY